MDPNQNHEAGEALKQLEDEIRFLLDATRSKVIEVARTYVRIQKELGTLLPEPDPDIDPEAPAEMADLQRSVARLAVKQVRLMIEAVEMMEKLEELQDKQSHIEPDDEFAERWRALNIKKLMSGVNDDGPVN